MDFAPPRPPDTFYDDKVFSYTFNPHRKNNRENLAAPALFQTVIKPEDRKKKVIRVQRDPSVQHLCMSDGSVNFQKLANYLRDNQFVADADYDVEIRIVPFWNIKAMSVYPQVHDVVYKLYQAKLPKDDKAVQAFVKEGFGKMNCDQYAVQFVEQLNQLLAAPRLYSQFTAGAMFLNTAEFDALYYKLDQQRDFRHMCYFDVERGLLGGKADGIPLLDIQKPAKGQPDRVFVRASVGLHTDHLNYLERWCADPCVDTGRDVYRHLVELHA